MHPVVPSSQAVHTSSSSSREGVLGAKKVFTSFEKLPKEILALIASFSGPTSFFEVCTTTKNSEVAYLKQEGCADVFVNELLEEAKGKLQNLSAKVLALLQQVGPYVRKLELKTFGSAEDLQAILELFPKLQKITFSNEIPRYQQLTRTFFARAGKALEQAHFDVIQKHCKDKEIQLSFQHISYEELKSFEGARNC